MRRDFEIELHIGDNRQMLRIGQPPGGGSGYDISYYENPDVNKYWHLGTVILSDGYWVFHMNSNDIVDMVGMELIAFLLNGDESNYPLRIEIRHARDPWQRKSRP